MWRACSLHSHGLVITWNYLRQRPAGQKLDSAVWPNTLSSGKACRIETKGHCHAQLALTFQIAALPFVMNVAFVTWAFPVLQHMHLGTAHVAETSRYILASIWVLHLKLPYCTELSQNTHCHSGPCRQCCPLIISCSLCTVHLNCVGQKASALQIAMQDATAALNTNTKPIRALLNTCGKSLQDLAECSVLCSSAALT